ncbi:hypothetical protein NLO88_11915 [Pseudomonas syringae]|uniref:hypothetical protein n=1 Tax=Pseudomonas quasicaspiana TaxID=2829821 RepID=UPI001E5B1DC7|nr:hypothetical protein [Pseudomonas quasicaspiana]MCD5973921.1 hypothetical protein [Pseudomonas quasicaspiana]MCD5975660.1 hypothetical protein [Pseudomonas quasicaspiana]MCQ3031365.1 hypothetical protein [Pseudomonas syringae]MDG6399826.1 hypothetical protein [Pseudomonas quasicaspiana]
MMQTDGLQAFLARYFPTFIGAFFLAVFSISAAISLASSTYFREYSERGSYSAMAAIALSVVLCFGNFMMIRGRTWGVWIIVALLIISLLTVLLTFGYRPHMFSYTTGILFPLLGLLMLNSKRHREMREELVKVRAQRVKARNKGRKHK